MKVYAIENNRNRLLLVRREFHGGIYAYSWVVNGAFVVQENEDGSVSRDNWKAYYVMQAPKVSGDSNEILNEVDRLMDQPMVGG